MLFVRLGGALWPLLPFLSDQEQSQDHVLPTCSLNFPVTAEILEVPDGDAALDDETFETDGFRDTRSGERELVL